MAVILRSDPLSRIHPEPQTLEIDHFDYLPDSILLLVFNKIGDVKALGRCCVVSKRFHSLVPQVENVVVRVDCVISDNESSSLSSDKPRSAAAGPFSAIFRLVTGSGTVARHEAVVWLFWIVFFFFREMEQGGVLCSLVSETL
ncbi:unnamed protein product [Microthlaspi erraticum]|uniref:F-box domain-containing protein n=1 Tax=Microthlaspi erraticum TaxID=1685480 RepID=A0A6D2J9C5_9BRAS|nr:unnamed protein product [Microthlaspi erraticum]